MTNEERSLHAAKVRCESARQQLDKVITELHDLSLLDCSDISLLNRARRRLRSVEDSIEGRLTT